MIFVLPRLQSFRIRGDQCIEAFLSSTCFIIYSFSSISSATAENYNPQVIGMALFREEPIDTSNLSFYE